MKKNVGSMDRAMRGLVALALILVAALAAAPLAARLGLAATGTYLLFTALAGSCLGYRLMGRSTCPLEPR